MKKSGTSYQRRSDNNNRPVNDGDISQVVGAVSELDRFLGDGKTVGASAVYYTGDNINLLIAASPDKPKTAETYTLHITLQNKTGPSKGFEGLEMILKGEGVDDQTTSLNMRGQSRIPDMKSNVKYTLKLNPEQSAKYGI